MREIQISDDVWDAIAKRGKFGETENDVLRRVFGLPVGPIVTATSVGTASGPPSSPARSRIHRAKTRMSTFVSSDGLTVSFATGEGKKWALPARTDKAGIRKVRDTAVEFARTHGATLGQENAVKKALTDSGYHLMK